YENDTQISGTFVCKKRNLSYCSTQLSTYSHRTAHVDFQGLKVNLKQLKHISVVDETCSPATIRYFPEYKLPTNTHDRLSVLFDAKTKWKHEEIIPFISNLTTTEQNASIILTKFCRVSSPEGQFQDAIPLMCRVLNKVFQDCDINLRIFGVLICLLPDAETISTIVDSCRLSTPGEVVARRGQRNTFTSTLYLNSN
ncbi:unnamed protein product, partial [Allacma fusca]